MKESKATDIARNHNIRFIIAFLVTFAILFFPISMLNWLEDPFGFFGTPRFRYVNDIQSRHFFSSDRRGQMTYLSNLVRTHRDHIYMLGTSRMLRGFNVCDKPQILRLTLGGMSLDEISQIIQLALSQATKPMRFIVELGHAAPDNPLQNDWSGYISLGKALFNAQTTLVSLSNLYTSFYYADVMPENHGACKTIPRSPVFRYQYGAMRFKKYLESFKSVDLDINGLRDLLDTISPYCDLERHEFQFINFPVLPEFYGDPEIKRELDIFFEQANKLISSYSTINKCSFRAHDYSAYEMGTENFKDPGYIKKRWYDQYHFKSIVGESILHELMEVQQ